MNLFKVIVSLAVLLSLVGGASAKYRNALRTLNGAGGIEGNKDRKFVKGMQRRRANGKVRVFCGSKHLAFLFVPFTFLN